MMETTVIEAARRLREAGEDFVIATVVAVSGSAYRRPGARMVLSRERWVAGCVSGGCLEGDVIHKGWWRTERGPMVVTYDSTIPDDADADDLREGLGLGCNGIVDVLLERASRCVVDPLGFQTRCRELQRRGALVTVFGGETLGTCLGVCGDEIVGDAGDSRLHELLIVACRAVIESGRSMVATFSTPRASVQALIEVVQPPPRLFVLGAGHDAVPVVALARTVGWDVIVCAPYARPAIRERFPDVRFGTAGSAAEMIDASDQAAVVVMNHHIEHDCAALAMAMSSRARYIGVLGPRRRTAQLLAATGVRRDARVHAPVGLELGAETPAQIALSIVAEVQAVFARAPATSLRDHAGPIHPATWVAGNGEVVTPACDA